MFELTKEQRDIKRAAREFAEKEFKDVARELDEKEQYDDSLRKKAAALGFNDEDDAFVLSPGNSRRRFPIFSQFSYRHFYPKWVRDREIIGTSPIPVNYIFPGKLSYPISVTGATTS